MTASARGSSDATWRELREFSVAILSIDVIAIGLGGLLSRSMGVEMWMVGAVVAAYVTLSFAVLIGGDLAIGAMHQRWVATRERRRRSR
jgi:hypothetical protein